MNVKPLDYLRAVRDDQELSPTEQLVALYIMSHAGSDGTKAHPGNALLAQETGLSEKTIKLAIARLRDLGWIVQTYNGRGGNHAKASEYSLAIPKGHDVTLITQPKEHPGSPKVTLTTSQSNTSTLTDALINAPSSSTTSRGRKDKMITQEDIDYRDLAKKGFSSFLEEDLNPGLEALANLQRFWPDPSAIPFDHIVVGCFSWSQYEKLMDGASASDLGLKSLAGIVGYHLKTDEDLMQLAIKGWQQINRYDEDTTNSGYDPRVPDGYVDFGIDPYNPWAA